MKITARCHPALEPILPKPVMANRALPDWLREMPSEVEADSLGGAAIRTVKHCPPFIDALGLGIMIPLCTDLTVKDGEISWDWDPPVLTDNPATRSPIGVHPPEQAGGAPLRLHEGFVIKFNNHWALEVEEGWSLLFTHPFNRADLPFETLTGVVDCDLFKLGLVQFPALWRLPDFEGVIPRGTPVAQVVPVRRGEAELALGTMSEAEIAENGAILDAIESETGVYRKTYRR